MGRQATDWEQVFVKDTSDAERLPKLYKQPLKLDKKTNNPITKNGLQTLTDTYPKIDRQQIST